MVGNDSAMETEIDMNQAFSELSSFGTELNSYGAVVRTKDLA